VILKLVNESGIFEPQKISKNTSGKAFSYILQNKFLSEKEVHWTGNNYTFLEIEFVIENVIPIYKM
jgi:hypothetical protein